jgi:CBS domain-containing protein
MTAHPHITVRDVMTGDPVMVDGMATAAEALVLMVEDNVSSVVVDRRDERDEYGLVLIGDIARDIIGGGRPASRTNVYEIMEKPAPFLDAEMDIRYAIRHMSRCGFTHCIVVHGRELVGIVTLRELTIRHIAAGRA